MRRKKINGFEKIILAMVAVILATGFILRFKSPANFEWFVKEDNLIEWITVLFLLLASFICIARFITLFKKRSWWFLLVTVLLGLFLFFAAGEEISWGQRILGVESSEFFEKNNAQGETNLHNLVVNGVKINKLIFSIALSVAMGIYLLLIPFLYQRNSAVKNFMDKSGAPIPRLYQIAGFILVLIFTSLLNHEKYPELLECCGALLFYLIVKYPKNIEIYT